MHPNSLAIQATGCQPVHPCAPPLSLQCDLSPPTVTPPSPASVRPYTVCFPTSLTIQHTNRHLHPHTHHTHHHPPHPPPPTTPTPHTPQEALAELTAEEARVVTLFRRASPSVVNINTSANIGPFNMFQVGLQHWLCVGMREPGKCGRYAGWGLVGDATRGQGESAGCCASAAKSDG
jgi:hypothetical protein